MSLCSFDRQTDRQSERKHRDIAHRHTHTHKTEQKYTEIRRVTEDIDGQTDTTCKHTTQTHKRLHRHTYRQIGKHTHIHTNTHTRTQTLAHTHTHAYTERQTAYTYKRTEKQKPNTHTPVQSPRNPRSGDMHAHTNLVLRPICAPASARVAPTSPAAR
jgi:hypothetical protein